MLNFKQKRFGDEMTLLGNRNLYEEEQEEILENRYNTGLYKRDSEHDIPMQKCLLISTLLHPIVAGLIWLAIFILALLGITFTLFDKPQQKAKDIEFVLVSKEAEPINKNTKYRAEVNSRAGGKHDPNRPVSMPQASSQASKPKQPSPVTKPKQAQKPAQRQLQQAQPKTQQKPKQQQTQSKPFAQQQNTQPPKPQGVPKAPNNAPKPALAPSAPKVNKPQSTINIPAPKIQAPKVAGPSGGPITGAKSGSGSPYGSSGTGTKSAPAPSFSPSGSSTATGGRFSPGSAGMTGSSGNIGNPSPGNPKGLPGIDAIKEPDFGPYMKELQRRIKMNWEPPKGNESKRVVLLFKIARDGRLISHRVYKSSGLPAADRAAMQAVELTAPFKPLPPEYKGDSVDIQFTFDYNVFGATAY